MRNYKLKNALITGAIVIGAMIVYAFIGQPIVDAITNAFTTAPTA